MRIVSIPVVSCSEDEDFRNAVWKRAVEIDETLDKNQSTGCFKFGILVDGMFWTTDFLILDGLSIFIFWKTHSRALRL